MAYNKVILMGRLIAKPEMKATSEGTEFCKLCVAIDRKAKGNEKQTDFINCTAWRQTAAFIDKYFDKGSMIHIEGKWRRDAYDKDGEKRYSDYCLIDSVEFCGSKSESGGSAQSSAPAAETEEDIEYPF